MGSLAWLPAQNPTTGAVGSNSSQMLIALIAPPAEATAQLSFFGEVVEGIDVLNSLVAGDMIEEVRIAVEQ